MWCICLSIEVIPSFAGFQFSTTVMARKKKPEGKINANTGKVPQEVAKDNSRTLKSVAPEDIQHHWHQSVHDLPPGQFIDIPYLKQLAVKAIVPIAYCIKTDFDIVENFVPAYLLRFTKNIWHLLDEEDILLSPHNWEDGDDSILNLFGTYMQHPEEQFVLYFGGRPFKEGSPRRSPRKTPEQRSPARSPMKTPDVIGEQPETSSQLNCTSKPYGEENVYSRRVSTRHIESTDEDRQKLDEEIHVTTETMSAAATVTETAAVATTAVATKTASNNNANPRPNVQEQPRKANYQQLPLKKHRPSTVYYHSAFTTYSRHNRPENVASTLDVLDTLLKAFSSRARVDSKKKWNSTISSWTSSKNKLSILSLPPLTQESNVGDDGLMSQSKFDVNIKDDEFLTKLCPDPHLFISSMPSDDQLKKQYSKLLKGVIMLKQKISRGKTLSAVRRRGELMDLKIADISAKDVMLDIDDAEFLDWCTNNSYARLWHCSQVNKSAILQLAIKNTIQRSPHPDLVNIFDECDDIQLQFVGFVTAPIQHNVVTGLHIHSCALYYTHGGDSKTTIVICAITSRIHILSMMQDRVFQFVQLLQHDVTRGYSFTLTNQFIGTDVILNDSSISGYESMGFNTKSMTQDVQQGQFTITVDNPIPLMPYSDRFTWAKYGHHILYSGIIPTSASPPPHHPKFTSITHCHFWKQSRHRRHPPTTPNAS